MTDGIEDFHAGLILLLVNSDLELVMAFLVLEGWYKDYIWFNDFFGFGRVV